VIGEVPDEFDLEFYRNYDDLRGFSDDQLRSHYAVRAHMEGRAGSPWGFREHFVSLVPPESYALEIGPFCSPSLRGPNIRYFDVLDRAGLTQQALRYNFPSPDPPEIDYVSPTGDLSVVQETFDCVFSSHCIEHQPNLISHLNNVSNVLPDRGRYFLVIPDKRFCFDHFRCETTVAAVIGAHVEARTAHTAKGILEHRLLMTHNDPVRHWNGDHGEPAWQAWGITYVMQTCREVREVRGHYIDTHAWHFTPGSFRSVTTKLYEFGLIKSRPLRVFQTPYGRLEFCAIMQKST
jgi:SAM-dependent methyltransferase